MTTKLNAAVLDAAIASIAASGTDQEPRGRQSTPKTSKIKKGRKRSKQQRASRKGNRGD